MVGSQEFRTAMSRMGTAVNIITTNGAAGRYGVTASAVCSVSDAPPTILACINRTSRANRILKENGVLCLNILAGRHRQISERFSAKSAAADERFGLADDWIELATGAPALKDASAALDCDIVRIEEIGTHSVFFAEIKALRVHDDADGMVYFDRAYYPVGNAVASGC